MKKRKKNKLYKLITVIITLIIVVSGFYLGNVEKEVSTNSTTIVNGGTAEVPEGFSLENQNLQMFFFDVGQADSTLIIDNNVAMLIDAGEDDDGILLAQYIKKLGITKIDYVIGTHNHSDHIGGLDKIAAEFEIGELYMPKAVSTAEQKEYREIAEVLANKGKQVQNVEKGKEFSVGDAKGIVKYVDNTEPSNLNNSSIILQIILDTQDYLFLGDAEQVVENLAFSKNENERVDFTEVEVLKVGHHGSNSSSSDKFIKLVSPEIAIISVGERK